MAVTRISPTVPVAVADAGAVFMASSFMLPMFTWPRRRVRVIEVFPSVAVFDPAPIAELPITIWFVWLLSNAFVLKPIKIDWNEIVLLGIKLFAVPVPAFLPKNELESPVVL